MIQLLGMLAGVWAGMTLLQAWGVATHDAEDLLPPPDRPGAEMVMPPVAGIPYEEAVATLQRHRDALTQLPGAEDVGLGADAIYVYTDTPTALPLAVEGVPVKALPPMLPALAGKRGTEVLAIFARHQDELAQLPGVQSTGLGPDAIYVYTEQPKELPDAVEGIPVRALPVMGHPIKGVPHTEVVATLERHRGTLKQIPGVQDVALGDDAIYVYTENPDLLPTELEGIPVKALPPM